VPGGVTASGLPSHLGSPEPWERGDNLGVPDRPDLDADAAALTHAGGVVCRRHARSGVQFLLVTARANPGEWVLPKGHIDPGEKPSDTAMREVAEEAGVVAEPISVLRDIARTVGGQSQLIRFYLMRATGSTPATETRRVAWLSAEDAIERLAYDDARELVKDAAAAIARDDGES
jgi:8-oxo-dGTP pyrophosphatase MutT (NUDIX family)